jgi:hypothetical protein
MGLGLLLTTKASLAGTPSLTFSTFNTQGPALVISQGHRRSMEACQGFPSSSSSSRSSRLLMGTALRPSRHTRRLPSRTRGTGQPSLHSGTAAAVCPSSSSLPGQMCISIRAHTHQPSLGM